MGHGDDEMKILIIYVLHALSHSPGSRQKESHMLIPLASMSIFMLLFFLNLSLTEDQVFTI